MKLLNDNVLIERIPTQLSQIIHTPEGYTLEVENKGKVLAVGPGRLTKKGVRVPCAVSVGEVIMFYELAEAHKTAEKGEVIISEQKIWAVLN